MCLATTSSGSTTSYHLIPAKTLETPSSEGVFIYYLDFNSFSSTIFRITSTALCIDLTGINS